MALMTSIKEYFGTDCLYGVLEVEKTASKQEIKKAYYKKSLKYHPDKVKEEEKTRCLPIFQTISKVYEILSNSERRACYDECGEVDDDEIVTQNRDWETYWRVLFKKVTVEEIEQFTKEFKGTEEEQLALKKNYLEHEGDMDLIIETTLCGSYDDEDRYREIIQTAIDNGELPAYKNFTHEPKKKKDKRKRKAAKEAREAEEAKAELNNEGGGLKEMILANQQNRAKEMDSFFSDLEAKYCKPKNKTVKKDSKSKTSAATKRKRDK